MIKDRFRCRDMVKTTFLDVDLGTHLTLQNQDMHVIALLKNLIV